MSTEAQAPLWAGEQFLAAMDGVLDGPSLSAISGLSMDSRSAAPGDAFFAIQGPNRDGHDFVAQALDAGATVAVVRREFQADGAAGALFAASWTPHENLARADGTLGEEYVWAALDCPSAFAVLPAPTGKTIVLGQLSVRIDRAVKPGDKCVVIGWPVAIDGRKRLAGSAIVSEAGDVIAVGDAYI